MRVDSWFALDAFAVDWSCAGEHRLGSTTAERMPRRGGNWGLSRRDAAPPDRGGRCPAEPGRSCEPGTDAYSIRWCIRPCAL